MLFEQCVKWLLTMTEAVLSAFTHAMNTCQAAAVQEALKQDYETARHDYLQVLLVIAADLGRPQHTVQSQFINSRGLHYACSLHPAKYCATPAKCCLALLCCLLLHSFSDTAGFPIWILFDPIQIQFFVSENLMKHVSGL